MSGPPVEIVRSARRKRTIQASFVGDRIRVLVPAGLRPEEEKRHVEQMVARLTRKRELHSVDLAARARRLAEKYDLPVPARIEWSDRQLERWGSCTFSDRSVRISSRLINMPAWVLDYVIVHELAHLAVPRHSPAFAALVARYELGERAEGYLIAKSEPIAG
ncbi:MAG TPA: M48 family metallopeptidase [Acidimicrobiia bacterium]|nr:M48 family metallopeptidase [Acidimicrobiia bacterium]